MATYIDNQDRERNEWHRETNCLLKITRIVKRIAVILYYVFLRKT